MKTTVGKSALVRARVPVDRLRNVERILEQLGLKTSDAINMLMAQVERRQGLPFDVSLSAHSVLSADMQATEWTEALGEY